MCIVYLLSFNKITQLLAKYFTLLEHPNMTILLFLVSQLQVNFALVHSGLTL